MLCGFIVSARRGNFKLLLFDFAHHRYATSESRWNVNRNKLMTYWQLLEYAVNCSPAASLLDL